MDRLLPRFSKRKKILKRSRLNWLIRLILGIVLLAILLIWQDNAKKLVGVFGNIRWAYVPPLLGLSVLLVGVSSLKWRLFLRDRGYSVSVLRLMGLYTVGILFNNFFPSMVGGDLARGFFLGQQIDSQTRSLASVFLERFTGVIALLSMAIISLFFNLQLLREPAIGISILLIGGGTIFLIFYYYSPMIRAAIFKMLGVHRSTRKIAEYLEQFREEIRYFRQKPRLYAAAMGYSYLFHFFAILNVYVSALTIGIEPDFMEIVVVVPLILLISSVPVTLNGIGVWEWAFSIYLLPAGVPVDQGLAISLILRAKSLLLSLIGGMIILLDRSASPTLLENLSE